MKTLKNSQGLALFMVIFAMAVILLFLSASLFWSGIDTKILNNYKLATQVIGVADGGLQHALAAIESGYDFDTNLSCGTPPCTVVPNTSFPPGSDFSYTVTVENDSPDINNGGTPTNDTNNLVVLTSTASGPHGTKNKVQAYVKRSLVSFTPPAAVYIPASSATISFSTGSGFFITGDDTDYDGLPQTNPKPTISGVAPIYNAVRDSFLGALTSTHYDKVQGAGYEAGPPIVSSVNTTTEVYDVNQIALNFYNQPGVLKYLDGLNLNCTSSSPCTLGTDSSPQITYIREGATHIHLDGYVSGSGVLVAEGRTHLYGEFNFHGLVISVKLGLTGGTAPTDPLPVDYVSLRNNAKIFGGLLLGPENSSQAFEMQGSAKVYYSSKGLTVANNLCGSCLPQPARIFAWLDE